MHLSVLYRTHAGSNKKERPDWFTRRRALASLRTAITEAHVRTTFTFVVDGSLPDDLVDEVESTDNYVTVQGGRASSSMREAIRFAQTVSGKDTEDTIYWIAEDDYIYAPHSIGALVEAADAISEADYFTLYVPDETAWHDQHPSQPFVPAPPLPGGPRDIHGHTWNRTRSTTSTFGVRLPALRSDAWMLKLASTAGSPFDTATMHSLQGLQPFAWAHLLSDLDGYWSVRGVTKVAAKPPLRTLVNLAALAFRREPRILVAPVDDLAMHAEAAKVPLGSAWEDLALGH